LPPGLRPGLPVEGRYAKEIGWTTGTAHRRRERVCGAVAAAGAEPVKVPSEAAGDATRKREKAMEIIKKEVTVGSENMPCHLAMPASGGPYPGLVVVQEAFGLNGNIKNITDRFAAEGFAAIAPNLFFRFPDNVIPYSELPRAIGMVGKLQDDQTVGDMTTAINYLKSLKEVKPNIGTVGFCMGGRVAFLAACRISAVKASAPFYGGGMVTPRQPGTKAPIDYVSDLEAKVMAFFGGKDAFIPVAEVDKFREALQKANKNAEVVLYPDADHGFMCDERPSFHPGHAKEAWNKTVSFFKAELG
jgi:carboxymethylenebutenolidase